MIGDGLVTEPQRTNSQEINTKNKNIPCSGFNTKLALINFCCTLDLVRN